MDSKKNTSMTSSRTFTVLAVLIIIAAIIFTALGATGHLPESWY